MDGPNLDHGEPVDLFLLAEENVNYSKSVQEAIQRLLPQDDPLYRADFDVTEYINTLFPTEQSLSQLDETMAQIVGEMASVDTEMADLVQSQSAAGKEGQVALREAKAAIQELFTRIREIKAKTDLSESMVKEITRDIKQLDIAKRNLTSSITTLNHLHMLLSGLESLSGLVKQRRYAEIANLLPGILNVLDHFEKYMAVPQVKELADQVHQIRRELCGQVVGDFKDWLSVAGGGRSSVPILDLCRVVSVLDPTVKAELSSWYVQQQLAEYLVLFEDTQDCAWLDKIDHRYQWFRGRLLDFEQKSEQLFPADWDMGRRLTVEFCIVTKDMLEKIMQKRIQELDFKLLLFAIQRTGHFESVLRKRFPSQPIKAPATKQGSGPGAELEKDSGSPVKRTPQFAGMICRVFENYLHIYVGAQDRNLNEFLDQCVAQFKEDGSTDRPRRELAVTAQPLPSSGRLFLFFKQTIIQVNDISSNPEKLLSEIGPVFKKYLREYANRCLTAFLPKINATQVSSTAGLIQSLLKEGDVPRLSDDEQFLTCCILTTAEFCSETSKQLEEKLKERVGTDQSFQAKINMNQEQELFHNVTSSALAVLLQDLEAACYAPLQAMTKINWSTVDAVGDESPYVISLKNHLKENVTRVRDYLGNARKYFIQFCMKFVTSLMGKYLGSVFRCKSVSLSGAEQLLLDTHALKTFLLDLPSVDSIAAPKPPAVYTRAVLKGMAKPEMILKVVMSPLDKPETFLYQYMKLLPESDSVELQRVLEMKSVRRADQASIIELYRSKTGGGGVVSVASSSTSGVPSQFLGAVSETSSALAAPLLQLAGDATDSRIRKLEKLVKKRL